MSVLPSPIEGSALEPPAQSLSYSLCANGGGRSLGKIPGEAHADTAGHFITASNWGSEQTVSGTMQLLDNL